MLHGLLSAKDPSTPDTDEVHSIHKVISEEFPLTLLKSPTFFLRRLTVCGKKKSDV